MAKPTVLYVCQQCGMSHPRWTGRCSGCESWNTLIEEVQTSSPASKHHKQTRGKVIEFSKLAEQSPPLPRALTGLAEFDRVCGGGLVPGSVILVGGDPGIGKSTLLLQVAALLSQRQPCSYISGEEAVEQVRMRAHRLHLQKSPLLLASSTNVGEIIASLDHPNAAPLVIIDSIQTMSIDAIESAPGSVSQVRAAAHEFTRLAKKRGITVVMVGHVTKEGMIAGPKVLEHMVDTVLYFEGERGHQFRILRAVKNRFGATDEIGVFEMTQAGLQEVANPSALFLSERQGEASGSSVFAGIEGTRPLLVEIQALVSPAAYGTPRRAVIGWDASRLAMVLAVLETRCNIPFSTKDVYLNVAGGLKISEPAADLAVASALMSALSGKSLPHDAIFFGEIGLSGELRSVGQNELRLKEAAKLGFKQAFLPPCRQKNTFSQDLGVRLHEIPLLKDFVHF